MNEQRTELIVMGTHGRRGVAHAVMGNVAEQIWFHNAPMVYGSVCFKTTAVGPALHFSEPKVAMVVEGRLTAGPTPQVKVLNDGETKNDAITSLTPNAGAPPSKSGG